MFTSVTVFADEIRKNDVIVGCGLRVIDDPRTHDGRTFIKLDGRSVSPYTTNARIKVSRPTTAN